MSELPSSGGLDLDPGTDAPTPPRSSRPPSTPSTGKSPIAAVWNRRIEHKPGDTTQCNLWFPKTPIPSGGGQHAQLPVLVMMLAFSRFISATMIPSRTAGDILAGMWQLLGQLGAVTHRLWWDRE